MLRNTRKPRGSRSGLSSLQEAGISAKAHPAEGKNHTTINNDLGLADDSPTQEMFAFLNGVLAAERKKDNTPAGKEVNGLQLSLTADTSDIILKDGKIAKPA